jgi:hypothetical protein
MIEVRECEIAAMVQKGIIPKAEMISSTTIRSGVHRVLDEYFRR